MAMQSALKEVRPREYKPCITKKECENSMNNDVVC